MFNGVCVIVKRHLLVSGPALVALLVTGSVLLTGALLSPTQAQHFATPLYDNILNTRRASANPDSRAALKLFASTTVDRNQVYVGEQILVTREILAPSIAFNLRQQKFTVDGADVYALKKTKGPTLKNNTSYEQEQTVYAVFFKQPGVYEIPSTTYTATLPVSSAGPDAKSNPKLTTEIPRQSISVNAAPVPGNRWLAATEFSASAEWQFTPGTSPFVEGQPVARLYRFNVAGQLPSAIPNIELPAIEGIRFYANAPQAENSDDRTGVMGQLTQVINMIPGNAGLFTIPELSVKWWDINNQRWNTTIVPAESIEVRPSPLSKGSGLNDRYKLATGILLVLSTALLTTSLWLWHLLYQQSPDEKTKNRRPKTERAAWRKLSRALNEEDPIQIRKALLTWYPIINQSSDTTRLDQLQLADNQLETELLKLDATIYSQSSKVVADYTLIKARLSSMRKAISRRNSGRTSIRSIDTETSKLYPTRM